MHNDDPRRLEDLSAERVVIMFFLQNVDLRNSMVDYILGNTNSIEVIRLVEKKFNAACNTINTKLEKFPVLLDVLRNVLTQEGSFFYTLRQIVNILNGDRVQIVNKDNINKYLEIYEAAKTFHYMNLPTDLQNDVLSHPFILAAKNCNFIALNYLWNYAKNFSDLQRQMLKANDYEAFRIAAEDDRIFLLCTLWRYAGQFDGLQRQMLEANEYQAFVVAVRNSHVTVIETLWNYALLFHGVQLQMLSSDNCAIFRAAVLSGNTLVLDNVWEYARQFDGIQRQMLEANNYEALKVAVQNDKVLVLDSIWEYAKQFYDSQHQMLKANNYEAFRVAAEKGYTKVLEFLWEKAESVQQHAMLEINNYEAFRVAAQNGHESVLEILWKKTDPMQQLAMLKANDYEAFRLAAGNGKTDALKFLWNKGRSQQKEMLEAKDYEAFRLAAKNGHTDVLKFLWSASELEEGLQKEMLRINNEIFIKAAREANTKVLEFLWNAPNSQDIRREMLGVNDYEALAFIVKDPKNASFLKEFKSFIDKESIANSSPMKKISTDEWYACLEAAKNFGGKMISFVKANLIDPLKLDERTKRAICRHYQKLIRKEERDLLEESSLKRPRIERKEDREMLRIDSREEKERSITEKTGSSYKTYLDDTTITHQPKTRSPEC